MHLMPDAICALGSRHGIILDPHKRQCQILRYGPYYKLTRFYLKAGIRYDDGREVVFPFTPQGEVFSFLEQRISPCTSRYTGIDPVTCIKVRFTIVNTFRPKDPDFSTRPAIGFRLEAAGIGGSFRWQLRQKEPVHSCLFMEFSGEGIDIRKSGPDVLDMDFIGCRQKTWIDEHGKETSSYDDLPQHDRLIACRGMASGNEIVANLTPKQPVSPPVELIWCTWHTAILLIRNVPAPFRYSTMYSSLDDVSHWAQKHGAELFTNAENVDAICTRHNCGRDVENLMAYSLHSWMINTWWTIDPETGDERFGCKEGVCSAMSTVDVEFTQAPFYLAVWPELLGLELDWWTAIAQPGEKSLGDKGKGTRYLDHDLGANTDTGIKMTYPHPMEIEETANWIILLAAYFARTGDDRLVKKVGLYVRDFVAFLIAADDNNDGIPDKGCANTIDDGSPAIQYGRAQTYLAVKTLGALLCAAEVGDRVFRDDAFSRNCRVQAHRIQQTIHENGWKDDHFAVLLNPSADGLVDPWNGTICPAGSDGNVPGWDAAHIYTANTHAITDMLGLDLGINPEYLTMDITVAAKRTLTRYGCIHTDYVSQELSGEVTSGWAARANSVGWISMNMLRDAAAFRRGIDLRYLAGHYWEWQTTTNALEVMLFFETFNGNCLCWYPRGIACWGWFEALGGVVVDKVKNVRSFAPVFSGIRVPFLFEADWHAGTCEMIVSPFSKT